MKTSDAILPWLQYENHWGIDFDADVVTSYIPTRGDNHEQQWADWQRADALVNLWAVILTAGELVELRDPIDFTIDDPTSVHDGDSFFAYSATKSGKWIGHVEECTVIANGRVLTHPKVWVFDPNETLDDIPNDNRL